MQITVGELYDAHTALTQIINRPRNLPMTAKYRLAKLHTHLAPFYKNNALDPLNVLIQEYGAEKLDEQGKSLGWGVEETSEKFPAFKAAWDTLRAKTIDVGRALPLTLASLGDAAAGGIEANEFVFLGPFVTAPDEDAPIDERETNP